MSGPRVLMLGLDAADASVVQGLMDQGRAPNLHMLRQQGTFGRLSSPAGLFAGGVWPSFYTGMDVPSHGVFHNKLWRPEKNRVEVANQHWIGSRPCWESLPNPDLRLCLVDVPMLLGRPNPLNGVHVSGWGTHDVLGKGSWPRDLWRELRRRHGRPAMPPEQFGAQTTRSLAELYRALRCATLQLRDITLDLLQRERWDLACVVFGATHRAGHYLWHCSQGANDLGADQHAPGSALPAIYQHVDEAVGTILSDLDRDTLVIVFAVHGMGPNRGWSDLLPDILAQAQAAIDGRPPKRGMLYSLRQSVPFHWVRPVLTLLPSAITDQLVALWSARMFDWSSTAYFPMPMDQAGYIRINLRGREPQGTVDPGEAYETLCGSLEQLLLSLRDEDSGMPLVSRIVHGYRDAKHGARYRNLLPDLILPWSGPPASETRHVISSELPGFRYTVPGCLPSGRSGNHNDSAWFIAHGPGVAAGVTASGHDVKDLLPTALRHLGVELPSLQGKPIDLRCSADQS